MKINYNANKKRKEENRRKKQEAKRLSRLSKSKPKVDGTDAERDHENLPAAE